ncbi:MAG: SIS domain-containing protein [Candidatus Omnitrophica bacterium]|nr:SIS domain-containing protein [Candidatus Omnitrophota bacterium]
MSYVKTISELVAESIATKQNFLRNEAMLEKVSLAAESIVKALRSGNKVITFGNGGSASDSQHLAAELIVRFEKERKALPCISLNDNPANISAAGNDYDFKKIFSRQLEALLAAGDVVVAISTSGTSPNIIEAVNTARTKGAVVIALSGKGGGTLKDIANISIIVDSKITARIQETHIMIIHILCKIIDSEF